MSVSTASLLDGSPYIGYSYGYPHKTAYGPLDPWVPLEEVWRDEDRSRLFAYFHIPFCEMRCGFCNLFTTALPPADLVRRYLDSLERHVDAVLASVPEMGFSSLAIGGGTPTYLEPGELERLLGISQRLGADPRSIPASLETSPATATPERLALLREAGVRRISMGVQSFNEAEARAMGRPQRNDVLESALRHLAEASFPCLNLDLIYGAGGQAPEHFVESVEGALDYAPEELYLYPLYVRPLTGLGKRQFDWDDQRLESYRAGRDVLLERGYKQVSMRMFQKSDVPAIDGPAYCCQRDGMLGIGCGARSYTRALHYSSEYAVGRNSVRDIIEDYLHADSEFRFARHGIRLSREEQARRFVIVSLLQAEGLSLSGYAAAFYADPGEDFPALRELVEMQFAEESGGYLRLTSAGLERSDAIGPMLYSAKVRERSEAYQWT